MREKSNIFIVTIIISLIVLFYVFGFQEELSLKSIQDHLEEFKRLNKNYPVRMQLAFIMIYILITSLSIPGAIILTLLSGTLFGIDKGTVLVNLSCTIGATISFFVSRFILREEIYKRFSFKFERLNQKFLREDNGFFLMRPMPVYPFVLVNLLMGLTSIRPWSYVWITFLGMLPGNMISVLAGKNIS